MYQQPMYQQPMQQPMYQQQPMQQGYAPQMPMMQPQGMSTGVKVLIAAAVVGLLYFAYTTMSKPAAPAGSALTGVAGSYVPPTTGGPVVTPGGYNPPTPPSGSSGSSGGSSGAGASGSGVKSWIYKGCFVDNGGHRGLPDDMGVMDFNSCKNAAVAKGYNMLGMQYHDGSQGTQNSQCWGGKDAVYDALGPAGNCTFNDAGGRIHGSFDSNAVYKLE